MKKTIKKDNSTLIDKINSFNSYIRNGKHFRQATMWEDKSIGAIYENDEFYITCLSSPRKYVEVNYQYCHGLCKIEKYNISKESHLQFYSFGKDNNDLIIECYFTHPQQQDCYHIIKELTSFVTSMINSNPNEMVQLQRYDLISKFSHENRALKNVLSDDELTDEEKELYRKYFREKVTTAHFHFANASYQSSLAISLDDLIKYVSDLISAKENSPLNKYSLGMPFLRIKKMNKSKKGNLNDTLNYTFTRLSELFNKYPNPKQRSILAQINKELLNLNLTYFSDNTLNSCLLKLYILKILNDPGGNGNTLLKMFNDNIAPSNGTSPNKTNDNFADFLIELLNLQLEISNKLACLDLEKENDIDDRDKNDDYMEK